MRYKTHKTIDFTQLSTQKLVENDRARNINTLDRSLFDCVIKVIGIFVPESKVSDFRKKYKKQILRIPNVKPVLDVAADDTFHKGDHSFFKMVLLNPSSFIDLQQLYHTFEESSFTIPRDNFQQVEINLDYTNWNYDEILSQILPKKESIGGFSIVGHIAHLNLKEPLLPYKNIIGEVILDKVSNIKMVVNKLTTIDNTFRNFKMEVIAGEGGFETTVKEHGCSFMLDFSLVYWNPRLSTEHQRLVQTFKPCDTIFDVFCGVGPFVVPAAKKGCRVIANDLNPHSVAWLRKNIAFNKVKEGRVEVHNIDGGEFIKEVLGAMLRSRELSNCHVIMNLPAMAVSFLHHFKELCGEEDEGGVADGGVSERINGVGETGDKLDKMAGEARKAYPIEVMIHCYTFSKHDQPREDAVRQVKLALGLEEQDGVENADQSKGAKRGLREGLEGVHVTDVRNVAPNKHMLCVSFPLPSHLLFSCDTDQAKKVKLE